MPDLTGQGVRTNEQMRQRQGEKEKEEAKREIRVRRRGNTAWLCGAFVQSAMVMVAVPRPISPVLFVTASSPSRLERESEAEVSGQGTSLLESGGDGSWEALQWLELCGKEYLATRGGHIRTFHPPRKRQAAPASHRQRRCSSWSSVSSRVFNPSEGGRFRTSEAPYSSIPSSLLAALPPYRSSFRPKTKSDTRMLG